MRRNEDNNEQAQNFLSQLYIIGSLAGLLLGLCYFYGANDIVLKLGASPRLFEHAVDYLKTLSLFSIPLFLQVYTQTFLVLAGKPDLGFYTCFFRRYR